MKKAKLETNVNCSVCSCKHNVNGCLCNRNGIDICEDDKNKNAHFCKTYVCREDCEC